MLRRSTILMLLTGAGAAVFSYTPTAAQWLTIGREQGYVPETVPAEVTDPPVMAAAALTILTTFAVFLVTRFAVMLGWSPLKTAGVVQVVTRTIEDHGREIITGRKRRAEIREEIAHADAERDELAREYAANEKERQELAAYSAMADNDVLKAEKLLDQAEAARDDMRKRHTANIARGMEVQSKLLALRAAKYDLVKEQGQLA